MKFTRPPVSNQRLQRYHRWALLWLQWFAAFLDAAAAYNPLSRQAEALALAWLAKFERLITNIIMLKAAERVRFRPRGGGRAQYPLKERALRRAVLGVKLRRALRRHDARERAAALRQDIAPLIAALVRRLPRGLTRRRPVPTRAQSDAMLCALLAAGAAHFSDSS
ncbi:MAG: hypothetical protein WAU68_14020 [Vitreimonas sp.]